MVHRSRALAPLGVVLAACAPGAALSPGRSCTVASVELSVQHISRSADLLFVVDDSAAVADQSPRFAQQLARMVAQLTDPPCISAARPSPHACDPTDPQDLRAANAATDLHVAVVSSDLGSGPRALAGCSVDGDQGLLDPRALGDAARSNAPALLPGCGAPVANEPAFLQFESQSPGGSDVALGALCAGALGAAGCVLQQPLEAAWRALVLHDASDHAGNTDPNAGFVRDESTLAIVVLASGDDASVRDCRFAQRGDGCVDATDVFDPDSTRWASRDVATRPYLAAPCGAQDPTWSLDRYVDPTDPNGGFFGIKRGRPDRVLFAAIAGVPRAGDGFPTAADGTPDWTALLGDAGPNGDDDFCGRDTRVTGDALATASAEGAVSMRSADVDPACPSRVVPACRRERRDADPSRPACTLAAQYAAPPARRLAEIARRFAQAPLCGGEPCGAGALLSICDDDFAGAVQQLLARFTPFFQEPCLPRVLQQQVGSDGLATVACVLREYDPGLAPCDPAHGRVPSTDGATVVTLSDGMRYAACEVTQLATDPARDAPPRGTGWYYATRDLPNSANQCSQRIAFSDDAVPSNGKLDRLECVQTVACAP